jgi:hypothetical protein
MPNYPFSEMQKRAVEQIMARCLSQCRWHELAQRIDDYCQRPENRAVADDLKHYVFKG